MELLKLSPAKVKFRTMPRGQYIKLIYEFMESGADEMNVEMTRIEPTYNGLRHAIKVLGMQNAVEVHKWRGEIHLIRK